MKVQKYTLDRLMKLADAVYNEPDNRALPVIERLMTQLGGWADFHPLMSFQYLATWMNTLMVECFKNDLVRLLCSWLAL